LLLLLRHTGARPKELLNVSWTNLDQSRNELTIPWDINKTNKGRVIFNFIYLKNMTL